MRIPLARLALAVSLLGPGMAARAEQAKPERTLYQRLGGYDAIAAVTDDFIRRLAADPQFARFFGGLSTDSRLRLRQLVVELLCQRTGGPCVYTGRSMKVSHTGLGITAREWEVSASYLAASLDKFHVGKREKGEVLTAAGKLRPDIVER